MKKLDYLGISRGLMDIGNDGWFSKPSLFIKGIVTKLFQKLNCSGFLGSVIHVDQHLKSDKSGNKAGDIFFYVNFKNPAVGVHCATTTGFFCSKI